MYAFIYSYDENTVHVSHFNTFVKPMMIAKSAWVRFIYAFIPFYVGAAGIVPLYNGRCETSDVPAKEMDTL